MTFAALSLEIRIATVRTAKDCCSYKLYGSSKVTGLQKDAEDARASSFLKLIEMLPLMSRPPTYLFVENVVGFEVLFIESFSFVKIQVSLLQCTYVV